MGCDIQAHVEIKLEDGRWIHWNHPTIPRSYAFFGLLAGVRSDELEPIAQPRGFPEDATETTRLDYEHWQVDHHTPSWLTAVELAKAEKTYAAHLKTHGIEQFWSIEQWTGYIFGNGFDGVPADTGPAKDARMIFWFVC